MVVRHEGAVTSVMLVSWRDGVLKVLYFFGEEPKNALQALIQKVAGEKGIYSYIFAHPELVKQAGLISSVSLKVRFRTRFVGISKKIMETMPDDIIIQLGDGDSAFT